MEKDTDRFEDVEIVDRVMNGDINAFAHLMTRHKENVIKIVARHLPHQQVEETVQDVFVRAYQSLPTLKRKDGFKQWLATIARRTCHDFWRTRYRTQELPMSSLTDHHRSWLAQVIATESGEALFTKGRQKEAGELLDWGLAQLSADERMILELVHLEGLPGKEVARQLGLSVASVKVRAFRARHKLKKLLNRFMEEG